MSGLRSLVRWGNATVTKKRDYYHVSNGEWIMVPKRGYKEQCCDCGLVHRLNFKVDDRGRIHIQTFRDHHATGGARSKGK
jgi:hypothetical protein